jgi:hypothetical protein
MALKASLDHTKEAALPAALAGVQAVGAGMHWLVAHSVGMSRRLCAACTWRSYPGFTPEQFTTFAHFSVSSPPPRHQIDGRPSGKVAAGQGCA